MSSASGVHRVAREFIGCQKGVQRADVAPWERQRGVGEEGGVCSHLAWLCVLHIRLLGVAEGGLVHLRQGIAPGTHGRHLPNAQHNLYPHTLLAVNGIHWSGARVPQKLGSSFVSRH